MPLTRPVTSFIAPFPAPFCPFSDCVELVLELFSSSKGGDELPEFGFNRVPGRKWSAFCWASRRWGLFLAPSVYTGGLPAICSLE
jgi:hypothetical protein